MKLLLLSRKFWAAIFLLVAVVISTFSAGFELDADQVAGLVVIIVTYIIGVAVDPGPGGWRGVVQSRKFWAAVVGLVLIFLKAFSIALPFGLTGEHLVAICVTIGAFISGVALEKFRLPA